jgi:hypothetical protein
MFCVTSNQPVTDRRTWTSRSYILILLGVTFCVFAQACLYDFIRDWDDGQNIAFNADLNPATPHAIAEFWRRPKLNLYIPLTYTLWAAITPIARTATPDDQGITLNPYVFHTLNIAVHLCAVWVLFSLLKRFTRSETAAFFAAALFAIHPLQVEPVAWVMGLKDVLSGFLSLVCVRLYVAATDRWAEPDDRWRGWALASAALVTAALAALAKPASISLPIIVACVDRLLLNGSWRRFALICVIGALAAAPVALVTSKAQGHLQSMWFVPPLTDRPLIALDALSFYARKLIVPGAMLIDYARSPWWVLHHPDRYWTWTIPVLVGALAVVCRRRIPEVTAGALIFLFALLPVLGLTPFYFQDTSTVSDRYAYVALAGPAIALAGVLSRWGLPTRLIRATGVVLLLLAFWSLLQVTHWRDERSLFSHESEYVPASTAVSLGRSAIASRQHDGRQVNECMFRYADALPDVSEKYRFIARLHAQLGEWDPALAAARKALDLAPKDPLAQQDLAIFEKRARAATSRP